MEEMLIFLESIPDCRQEWKVQHKLSEVVLIVLLATLANADDWQEIGVFANCNEELLRRYMKLENGIPSHDTIQRVMANVQPEYIQRYMLIWNELLERDEGEKLKKLLSIDGKTIRGNASKNQEALHVVSAWSKEDGICFGQKGVNGKGKEIPAIKELLDVVEVKDRIVTIDAIGTQKTIVEKIIKDKGDYVIAVKENQPNLYRDIELYFEDKEHLDNSSYYKTIEKAHSQGEKREYWQTEDISWFEGKEKWCGLASIGMTKNTLYREGHTVEECRYYISSLKDEVKEFARSVRGHWAVESMHWHLDVTFREDKNQTLEKTAAMNLNIIRKWSLAILKILDLGKKYSMKKKRFALSCSFAKNIEKLMNL